MTTRALILAGGGLAGIAWETGILQGIADESPSTAQQLLDSDVLVGTSAGSTVAAQISGPLPLEQLYERQVAETSHELDPGVDIDDAHRDVPDRHVATGPDGAGTSCGTSETSR